MTAKKKKKSFNQRNMISGHFVYTIVGFALTSIIKNTNYCMPLNQPNRHQI